MSRFSGPLKPLGHFIVRAQVLSQYRTFFRVAQQLDKASAEDLKLQIRTTFRRWQHVTDQQHIKMLLTDGVRQIDALKGLVAAKLQPEAAAAAAAAAGAAGGQAQQQSGIEVDYTSPSEARRSSLGAPLPEAPRYGDPGNEEGRLGVGWPWERAKEDERRR